MRALTNKLKPAQGFSHYFHLGLTSFLPAIIFVLVRMSFVQVAVLLILLSKWRMFVVRPRYWIANISANAVDIIVGLSIVVFMDHTSSAGLQLAWATAYGVWLVFIKPGSNIFMVSMQAMIGQALGLVALYVAWVEAPSFGIVLATWIITYLAARHFFTNFEDQYTPLYAHAWGYFSASLTWVLSHWLLFYGVIPQPALLLSVIGFGLAGMFYLDESDRLSPLLRRQFMFIMFAIVLVVLVFSDWGDKTV
jgi:hypothetical protein